MPIQSPTRKSAVPIDWSITGPAKSWPRQPRTGWVGWLIRSKLPRSMSSGNAYTAAVPSSMRIPKIVAEPSGTALWEVMASTSCRFQSWVTPRRLRMRSDPNALALSRWSARASTRSANADQWSQSADGASSDPDGSTAMQMNMSVA